MRSAWTGPPIPARNLALAGIPAQPRFAPLQEKKITSSLKTQEKDFHVGFNRFVGFNFGPIQLLRFVIVMVRSNSFGHIDLVKRIPFISLMGLIPLFLSNIIYSIIVIFQPLFFISYDVWTSFSIKTNNNL